MISVLCGAGAWQLLLGEIHAAWGSGDYGRYEAALGQVWQAAEALEVAVGRSSIVVRSGEVDWVGWR